MPEIVPKVVFDPPLHVPKSFLLLGRRISMFFNRNVFGHYEGVDRTLFRALLRALFGLYSGLYRGSTRPTKVCLTTIILAFRKKDFYVFLIGMYLGTMKGWIGHYFGHYFGLYSGSTGSTKVLPGPPK